MKKLEVVIVNYLPKVSFPQQFYANKRVCDNGSVNKNYLLSTIIPNILALVIFFQVLISSFIFKSMAKYLNLNDVAVKCTSM